MRSSASWFNGLSPLARGTLRRQFWEERTDRFIPAGAGNTIAGDGTKLSQSVYPRWRGEHRRYFRILGRGDGLSPLARGTRSRVASSSGLLRFIPAGAGNTFHRGTSRSRCPVYPRWRGEHLTQIPVELVTAGLSPLARGTPYRQPLHIDKARFIPAGAGNTSSVLSPRRKRAGLSPLARGTHTFKKDVEGYNRFIPAGAGNTCADRPVSQLRSVYPRWRGEHVFLPIANTTPDGLSPLARGTLN